MKIGIIGINRYARFLNFACDLHAYAFQQFIALHGYESTILDYKPVDFGRFDMRSPAAGAEAKYRKAVVEKQPDSELNRLADLALGFRSVATERVRRYDKFEAFVEKHLTFTEQVYDSDLLEVGDPEMDCYVCVTDVIWKSLPRVDFDRGFLLGSKAFDGKRKIAYAASRGTSKDFSGNQEKIFFDYLEDFDAISVREQDFSEYIESHSEFAAPTVLDPVMLHGKDFWDQLTVKPREERFLLLYYVMEKATDTIAKAVEYAKLHDLTIVELSDRPLKFGRITDPDVKHIARYDVGMEEWLGYIKYAECVFTNSFHGCCFSLLFEKVFFVGSRNGKKVPNFLATFGLSDRQLSEDAAVADFSHDIDYRRVYRVLEEKRQESSAFILDALAAAEASVASNAEIDHAQYDEKRRRIAYPATFNSGSSAAKVIPNDSDASDIIKTKHLTSGGLEYHRPGLKYRNDGATTIPPRRVNMKDHDFTGWNVRFRIDNRWFWLLNDGSFAEGGVLGNDLNERKAVLDDGAKIPHIPVNHISVVVFVAQWTPIAQPKAQPSLIRRAYRIVRQALRSVR